MRTAMVLFMLAGSISAGEANYVNGNQLDRWCSDKSGEVAALGYVAGVADDLSSSGRFCAPTGTILKQIVDATCKQVKSEPGSRLLPANILVRVAIAATWPCPKE